MPLILLLLLKCLFSGVGFTRLGYPYDFVLSRHAVWFMIWSGSEALYKVTFSYFLVRMNHARGEKEK